MSIQDELRAMATVGEVAGEHHTPYERSALRVAADRIDALEAALREAHSVIKTLAVADDQNIADAWQAMVIHADEIMATLEGGG